MARSHAPRFPLQFQSPAAHHPYQPPARLPRDRRPIRRRAGTPARRGQTGPLLFQLPPNFKADAALLADFLSAPAFAGPTPPMAAFEFRNESWFAEETYAVLRLHNAALCIAESDDLRTPEVQCARTHACYRLRCSGGYSEQQIAAFAERFSALSAERDVYIYFKHEDEPSGALNAVAFLQACADRAGKR